MRQSSVALLRLRQIIRGVNADGFKLRFDHMDAGAILYGPQLFQFLRRSLKKLGHGGILEEKVPSVDIEADMLVAE